MKFHLPTAEIFIPDGLPVEQALARTTHMCISAHQDDIEIMAAGPILDCFQQKELWFTGVVVTDGRGSPRDDLYKDYDDEEMRLVRFKEQKKAAVVGEYAAQVMLDYPSKIIKNASQLEPIADLAALLKATRPQFVYTHNPGRQTRYPCGRGSCVPLPPSAACPKLTGPKNSTAVKSGATWTGWWMRIKPPST